MRWGFPEGDHGRSRLQYERPTFGAPQPNLNYSAANLHCGPEQNAFDVRYQPPGIRINVHGGFGGYRGPSTFETVMGGIFGLARVALGFYAVSKFGNAMGQTRIGGWFNNMIGSWGGGYGGYNSGMYPANSWVNPLNASGMSYANFKPETYEEAAARTQAEKNAKGNAQAQAVAEQKKASEELQKKQEKKAEPTKPAEGAGGAGGAGGAAAASPTSVTDISNAFKSGKAKAINGNNQPIQGNISDVVDGDSNTNNYPKEFTVTDTTNGNNKYVYVFDKLEGDKPVYKLKDKPTLTSGTADSGWASKRYALTGLTKGEDNKYTIDMNTSSTATTHL